MKTTTIIVNGATWIVPRGFGVAYKDVAADPADPDVLQDLLELVGFTAEPADIAGWTLRQRVEAEVYAVQEHLSASDNPVQRHPKPEWFPKSWGGASRGEGVFAGPGPSIVVAPAAGGAQ